MQSNDGNSPSSRTINFDRACAVLAAQTRSHKKRSIKSTDEMVSMVADVKSKAKPPLTPFGKAKRNKYTAVATLKRTVVAPNKGRRDVLPISDLEAGSREFGFKLTEDHPVRPEARCEQQGLLSSP